MNVLFIYPEIYSFGGGVRLHYGIAYMSAVLKKDGHQTSLLRITKEISKEKLVNEVKRLKPDVICFSSTTNQFPYVKLYAGWVKILGIPIVCGGVHATLSPDEVISCVGIDIVCMGEGEFPLLELVNALKSGCAYDNIPNLWVKKNGEVTKNPIRPLITELDGLPFPDRELFLHEKSLEKWGGELTFMAGRGCPYGCTYCCNHALRKIFNGKGPYVRIRSVNNLLKEIRHITKEYGGLVKKLNFEDDTFTLFPKWLKEFTSAYKKEFSYPFSCNVRVETVNRQVLSSLKDAGCYAIKLGVESGDEWLRRNILKRSMTNEEIIRACKTAHELDLKIYVYNMLGLPFENPEMIEETLKLNRQIDPNMMQTTIFYPYPNTELYNVCKQEGFLTKKHKQSYFDTGTTLNLPALTQAQINHYYIQFQEMSIESSIKTFHPKLMRAYKLAKRVLRSRTAPLYRKLSAMS